MEKNYAGLKKRLLASLVDLLVIVAYIVVLLGFSLSFFYIFLDGLPALGRLVEELISFSALIFPVFLYLVITESSKKRGTFGKRKMNIYLDSNGQKPLTFFQVIIKNCIKLLPWQMAHTLIFTGIHADWNISFFVFISTIAVIYGFPIVSISFVCFRKDHRSLHDLIANTVVLES